MAHSAVFRGIDRTPAFQKFFGKVVFEPFAINIAGVMDMIRKALRSSSLSARCL